MGRIDESFIAHSDVQQILANLRLPLIGSRGQKGTVIDIVEADDTPQGSNAALVLPVEPFDVDVESTGLDSQAQSSQSQSAHSVGGVLVPLVPTASVVSDLLVDYRRVPLDRLACMSEDDCRNLTNARLVVVAAQSSRELQKQITKNKQLVSSNKQLKRKLGSVTAQYEKKLKAITCENKSTTLELTTSGKTGKRLTIGSIMSLGIRRNFANLAASDFGMVVLKDVSASTVIRSEIRCAAALVSDMKSFCTLNIIDFFKGDDDDPIAAITSPPRPLEISGSDSLNLHKSVSSSQLGWNLFIVALRSDATNSSIWKREKLHVLETVVGCVNKRLQPGDISYPKDDLAWLSTKKSLWHP